MITHKQLERYLELKEVIKELQDEMDVIKNNILMHGDFNSVRFSVMITEVKQNRVVGGEVLIEKLGAALVEEKGLIKESSYKKVTVKELNRKAA